jgi:sulfonate dioxygenase
MFSITNPASLVICSRLSPTFRHMLEELRALHTSEKMIGFARAQGGVVRKDPVTSAHPIIRVHPVTGERAIFVNSEFITRIEGMKMEESDLLIKFLVDHIIKGHDFQVRLNWKPRSVVMFDNRTTLRK